MKRSVRVRPANTGSSFLCSHSGIFHRAMEKKSNGQVTKADTRTCKPSCTKIYNGNINPRILQKRPVKTE